MPDPLCVYVTGDAWAVVCLDVTGDA